MTLEQTIATNFSTSTKEEIQTIITNIRKQFPDYISEKIIEKVVSQQNIIKQFIAQLAEETSIETKDLRESLSSSLIENIPESSNKIAKIIEELNQELNDFHEFINNKKEQLLTQIYAQLVQGNLILNKMKITKPLESNYYLILKKLEKKHYRIKNQKFYHR